MHAPKTNLSNLTSKDGQHLHVRSPSLDAVAVDHSLLRVLGAEFTLPLAGHAKTGCRAPLVPASLGDNVDHVVLLVARAELRENNHTHP